MSQAIELRSETPSMSAMASSQCCGQGGAGMNFPQIPKGHGMTLRLQDVAFTEFDKRDLPVADLDVEAIALYVDPRCSKLDKWCEAYGTNSLSRRSLAVQSFRLKI